MTDAQIAAYRAAQKADDSYQDALENLYGTKAGDYRYCLPKDAPAYIIELRVQLREAVNECSRLGVFR